MTHTKNYIITAANERYFLNVKQLIYTFKRSKEYQNSTLIFYDLGLRTNQIHEIRRYEMEFEGKLLYRYFKFEDYPDFVRPQHNTYSWKPILLYLTSIELTGNFLWMDSANCILKNLRPVWDIIEEKQTYAPISGSGTLKEWTVQKTLDFLNVPSHYYDQPNRAGNTFGFSNRSEVIKELLFKWKELALIKECIRPEGANRSNHRDDQSLLTILLLEQEEKGNLSLTNDRINISAGSPTPYISVRNLFPKFFAIKPGPLAHYYFTLLRYVDILINKMKRN